MRRLASLIALATALSACGSPEGPGLPRLVETHADVVGLFVGAGPAGTSLLFFERDEAAFDLRLEELFDHIDGEAPRPDWLPASTSAAWYGTCTTGLEDGLVLDPLLSDAWDGTTLFRGATAEPFSPGTLRSYDDGTLVLSCAATDPLPGLAITRHLILPGAGPGGRFMVEVVDVVGTAAGGAPLAGLSFLVNDGTDADDPEPWADHGTVGAFAWATKGASDLSDPAIGILPLLSTHVEVDRVNTRGDVYMVTPIDGATLGIGERAVIAVVLGMRGGFASGDAAGKDAAMVALGAELEAFAGGAFCGAVRPVLFGWTALIASGEPIAAAICAGYAALP
jgi:hypothetical protein